MSDLPIGWTIQRLGDAGVLFARRVNGYPGFRPYLATSDVNRGTAAPSGEFAYSVRPARADLLLKVDDVLQAKMKGTNKAFLVGEAQNGWLASTGFAQFNPQAAGNSSRFFLHVLSSRWFLEAKDARCVGSTQQAISDKELAGIAIALPPATEQAVIADVLNSIDTAIRETEAIISKLKAIKQGLLHDLLTRGIDANGELRPPQAEAPHIYKQSPLGWIPKDWATLSFGELADYKNGNTFDAGAWSDSGLPIIRIQNLNGSKTFNYFSGVPQENWHVFPGDLLFAWSGQRGISFGARIWSGPEGVLNQHIFKVVPRGDLVSKDFLFRLLRYRQSAIEDSAHGFKDSFLHVTRGELGDVLSGVPSLDEQRRIESLIVAYEAKLGAEEETLVKFRSSKEGLMDDLLTGRVRVTPLLSVKCRAQSRSV